MSLPRSTDAVEVHALLQWQRCCLPSPLTVRPRSCTLAAPPLASPLVAEALAGLQTTQDARIWLPADQLYGLRLAAGADAWVRRCADSWRHELAHELVGKPQDAVRHCCLVPLACHVAALLQVGVARGSGSSDPAPLVQLFAAADRLPGMQTGLTAGPDAEKQQFGACLVAAQVWPAQGLQKGTAALSPALRDALARPEARTRLLVYAAEQDSSISSISSSRGREADSSGSAEVAQRCTAAVYVRLCRRQGLGGSPGPALLPPVTSDEAASSSSAEAADQTATRMAPASPAGVLSPAMRGKAGSPVALSPAMRGGATPPIALSPAMRGGAAPPVALGPAGRAGSSSSTASPAMPSRGRPGSATLSSGSKSRPPTHLASSTSSASRGIAAAARADDRAKAEALLGKLLEEGEPGAVRGGAAGGSAWHAMLEGRIDRRQGLALGTGISQRIQLVAKRDTRVLSGSNRLAALRTRPPLQTQALGCAAW